MSGRFDNTPDWSASRYAVGLLAFFALLCLLIPSALALEPIELDGSDKRVELTNKGLAIEGRGDQLQIDTAPGADGISRRMSVRAATPRSDPNWIVFALRNTSDRIIERWITVERYSMIGSGIIWPDLDSRRLEALTPSVGFLPQRIDNDRADIFKITIDPGQTITYAAEMATNRDSRVYMWQPLEYELHVRERRLFNGIMLGITGLLGIFLTAVFAANHKLIFPSAALVTWCVLIYLCVDFGFWHKLLQISADNNAVYRAATEAAMATSLALFLHTFLRLGSWFGFVRMLSGVWIVSHLALVFIAVIDPRLAATFARLSFAAIGGIGALLILFLAVRGQDRALSLIPTWLLFLVWLFGATMTLTGKLHGELVVSALIAGLVLITVLIGFTVTQFAFRSVGPHYGAAPSEQQLRSLAVEGAAAAVWEWHARRDEIKIGAIAEAALGLNEGELSTKVKDFVRHMHPADQERFNVLLWTVQNRGGGDIRTDFRMRHADNSYRWFELEAASVPTSDRRTLRCVGLLRDVTDQKRAQARLMHDAVHCSLTGLPNRELLIDRVKTALARVPLERHLRPTVIFIDLDKFKSVNSSFGLHVGDSLLLTVSRRLSRHLGPMDTLARLGGDRFAMLILSINEPEELARLAESVRRSLRSPIKMAGQDIVLTGAIGIAVHDPDASEEALDLLRDAEVAMYRAKRGGADQIEIFRPEMRDERDDRIAIESDLRLAIERRQIKVFYQPIIYLPTEELAGFEALARWEHPRHGLLKPDEFIPVAEDSDLVVKLGSYVLGEAVGQAARWQKALPRLKNPLFVSVNVSSRQLFRQDLIGEIRHIIGGAVVPDGVLRLEVTESLVMENPERAADMLEQLRLAGTGLSLDDFGSGYSSLAYLERFPFDTIKIDRHLVQSSSGGEGGGPAIVRSIVALAQELDKKVVAEGVEAAEDVSFLRSIGCQFAQGYYYGEPMGEREVADLLKIVRKAERKLNRRGLFRSALKRNAKDEEKPAKPDKAVSAPAADPHRPGLAETPAFEAVPPAGQAASGLPPSPPPGPPMARARPRGPAPRAEFGAPRAEFGAPRAEFGTPRAQFDAPRGEVNALATDCPTERRQDFSPQFDTDPAVQTTLPHHPVPPDPRQQRPAPVGTAGPAAAMPQALPHDAAKHGPSAQDPAGIRARPAPVNTPARPAAKEPVTQTATQQPAYVDPPPAPARSAEIAPKAATHRPVPPARHPAGPSLSGPAPHAERAGGPSVAPSSAADAPSPAPAAGPPAALARPALRPAAPRPNGANGPAPAQRPPLEGEGTPQPPQSKQPPRQPEDFSTLPPSIAQSLARLAGSDLSSPTGGPADPENPEKLRQPVKPGTRRVDKVTPGE